MMDEPSTDEDVNISHLNISPDGIELIEIPSENHQAETLIDVRGQLGDNNGSCELADVSKMKVLDYGIKTTYQCGRFSVLVMLTLACMALVFYIIIDSHINGDPSPEWAIPLLTFIIGIWIPSPSWSKKKEAIQPI